MSLAPLRTLRDVILSGGGGPDTLAVQVVSQGKVTRSLSRNDLYREIENTCWELRRHGVRAGDVVSLSMDNTLEYIVVFFAVTWIRAIASPLNPNYKQGEVEFYLSDTRPKLAVIGSNGNEAVEMSAVKLGVHLAVATEIEGSANGLLRLVTIGREFKPMSSAWTWESPVPSDVALFLHTSGTTSTPKLVPLTHHNLCTSAGNIRNTYELDASDTSYLVMPLFHVHGLVGCLLSTLCSGGVVVLPAAGKFSANVFWDDILACCATWYTAVPTIHQILLQRAEKDQDKIRKARFRFIRSCSSSLAPAVLEQMEQTFTAPVLEAYAMTEASHQISSNPLGKNGRRKPGTVGRAMNVQVAILDANNKQLKKPRQVGEICIRGENVTTGYLSLHSAEANAKEFAAGWFHTGDQGFLDEDGYLTIVGRLKELINRGGEKISPVEIDAALLSHPKVSEAVSFGLADEKYGEVVAVAVVPVPGQRVQVDDILSHCTMRLSKEKIPSKVFLTDSIPKTATGKVQRRIVAAHFATASRL